MTAYTDLMEALEPGEVVESLVFGAWGWGDPPDRDGAFEPGFGEPKPPPVPVALRGRPMSLAEAEPFMQTWTFRGGFGSPDCYAVYVWTNRRVLWVHEYDGATGLASAPRNPIAEWARLS